MPDTGARPVPLPDPPLARAGVALRAIRESDVPAIVAACRDPLLPRFLANIGPSYDDADARAWIATLEPARESGARIELAIADARSDQLVGVIALTEIDWTHLRAATGYWLAPEARGRGFTTTALRLLMSWAFETLGLRRVALIAEPENTASQRVAERCGFVREGRLRSHLVNNGERRDVIAFGLLPGELREA